MTSLPIIAEVSRIVSRCVDRITGDRSRYPQLVAEACKAGLLNYQIKSQVLYGNAAWVEILEEQSPVWAGCWGDNFYFWLITEFDELVDLNLSIACRTEGLGAGSNRSRTILSPPMLWIKEVPSFCRYEPLGIAELVLSQEKDKELFSTIIDEIHQKCDPAKLPTDELELEFSNEPLLCQKRRLLDDTRHSFQLYDRALSIRGIPELANR